MTIVITKEALDSVNVHFTSLYITLHHFTGFTSLYTGAYPAMKSHRNVV